MPMLRYLVEPKSNFWSEPPSTSILCIYEQQRFWESVHLRRLTEPSLLENVISTKIFCAGQHNNSSRKLPILFYVILLKVLDIWLGLSSDCTENFMLCLIP